jgi:hypothetical protein
MDKIMHSMAFVIFADMFYKSLMPFCLTAVASTVDWDTAPAPPSAVIEGAVPPATGWE